MRKILGFAGLAVILAFTIGSANAATAMAAKTVTSCGGQTLNVGQSMPMTMDLTGELCTNATGGSGGATSTAASALPTISAGAGASLYESLGAGLYVQPIFSSAAGGGIQVDSTHGIPVQSYANAFADGWDLGVQLTTASASCASGAGVNPCLKQIDADIKGVIPYQVPTAPIGGVGIVDSAGTNVATVKAASKPSAVGDKALVVVIGANVYNTIAASQTTYDLSSTQAGGTGTTGDYLSHCTVIPTTVSPGVMTILDNTTAIYSFPGGTSSLSNLAPWSIPVGAISVSGGWHVVTGAGLSAVCVGKFT